jgi:hypothetical protein
MNPPSRTPKTPTRRIAVALALAAGLLSFGGTASAALDVPAARTLPTFICGKEAPPTLDGQGDEPAWTRASVVGTGFTKVGDPPG